ncbi:unnamed protein product [Sphenostylis stenocarpa]|uniref:Hydrophobic seed protein domain-containing protein n=1 Tax=Sphenostylis stenocarpa TaxID=92480 RepID=A0AA86SS00_9FABA|nr:unnamed protein product [Sphenostylis stenocarpa]
MSSKNSVASIGLLLSLNLLLFCMVNCGILPPTPTPEAPTKCPLLEVCASILVPPYKPDSACCPLLRGLVDLDAAACLCNVLKVHVALTTTTVQHAPGGSKKKMKPPPLSTMDHH